MPQDRRRIMRRLLIAATALTGLGAASSALALDFEIYGFAQADFVQDFNRVDPSWDDTLRPSRIPTTEGQFGDDGQSIISVRQSRFGVQASQDIAGKPLYAKFEFDMFGVGKDEGQTTIRLRHFYGTWGPILAGQTNSVFMHVDTFPNTIDYWGPNGMVFLRNPQIRYTYKTGGHELAIAVEKPGNDVDPGDIREIDPSLPANIHGSEKLPDLTAHWRYDGKWGNAQIAGILRDVAFDTSGTPNNEPKGDKLGWGVNVAVDFKTWGRDMLHLSAVYGEGIASYMNDGGVDLGPKVTDPTAPPPPPLAPDVVPLLGLVAYYDHYWNDHLSSSIGWSMTKVDNLSFQAANAFKEGQYFSANLLWTPDPHILMGVEYLWGRREDHNGASGDDNRIQVSFKYSFSSNDFLKN